MTYAFSGAGPGVQTPDGCSVELYRQLPYLGELDDIESALSGHAAVLELGCGTGRLCTRLLTLGMSVTGVDVSAQMLAHMPVGAERIQASIEALDLGRRWPLVLLPSHLINHPDRQTREAFVRTAHRHLTPSGMFFARRHHARWLEAVRPGLLGETNGVAIHADKVSRDGGLVTMTLRYEAFGQRWTQSFATAVLSDAEIEDQLRSCGFARIQWHGRERLWVSARHFG